MTPALLAIDAGGTSTRALALGPDGACHGWGVSGGGNPTASGATDAAASLHEAVTTALRGAAVDPGEVRGAVAVVAGASAHDDVIAQALAGAGVRAPLTLESDLLAIFVTGTATADVPQQRGYALIAGTGAAAIRVERGRVSRTADGLGWLLGDAGSGFWIGREVALAAVAHLEGSGPPTALTRAVLTALAVSPRDEGTTHADGRPLALHLLSERIYALPPLALARLAPLVFAPRNDPVARGIVRRAAAALVDTLGRVMTPELAGPAVLGGSVLSRQRRLAEAVEEALLSLGLPAPLPAVGDGVLGAAVLALRHDGVALDRPLLKRLRTSLAGLRAGELGSGRA